MTAQAHHRLCSRKVLMITGTTNRHNAIHSQATTAQAMLAALPSTAMTNVEARRISITPNSMPPRHNAAPLAISTFTTTKRSAWAGSANDSIANTPASP